MNPFHASRALHRRRPFAFLALVLPAVVLGGPLHAQGRVRGQLEPAGPAITSDHGEVMPLPDGRHVLKWDSKTELQLVDAVTGKPVGKPVGLEAKTGPAPLFSGDGKKAFYNLDNTKGLLWDLASGEAETVRLPDPPRLPRWDRVLHAPRLLFWRDERAGTVRAFDPFAGEFVGKPVVVRSRFDFLAGLSPDGNVLLVLEGAVGKPSNRAVLWDLRTGKQAAPPVTLPTAAGRFHLSPDGKAVLAVAYESIFNQGGRGRTLLSLYDATTGKRCWGPLPWGPDGSNRFTFSPDSKLLVGVRAFSPAVAQSLRLRPFPLNEVQAWDAATGKPLRRYPLPDGAIPPAFGPHSQSFVVSPDGRTLAVFLGTPGKPAAPGAGPGTTDKGAAGLFVRLWNVASGEPLGDTPPFRILVKEIIFSPDSKTFLTCTAWNATRPERDVRPEARLWKVPERSSGEKTPSSPGKSGTDRKDR